MNEINSLFFESNAASQWISNSIDYMKLLHGANIVEVKTSDEMKEVLELRKGRIELYSH